MGKHDSSKTRVAPVFDELANRDATGAEWLAELIAMPARPGGSSNRAATPPIREAHWGTDEKSLRPPQSLLRWMISNPEALAVPGGFDKLSASTREKRRALLAGEAETREAALDLLKEGSAPPSVWYVLEGRTRPDVFLTTDDAVVVIEGKRTEPGATTSTSWLPKRDQMVRHLDCAWEILDGRALYGFYVVEAEAGTEVPERWTTASAETISDETLKASLPHRDQQVRDALRGAFLGACTWQQISAAFRIELEA